MKLPEAMKLPAAVKLLEALKRWGGRIGAVASPLGRALAAAARKTLWSAGLPQAFLESSLLMALILWMVLPPMQTAPDLVIGYTFMLFAMLCGAIAGLRARLLPGRWRPALLREALSALPLALLLALVSLVVLALNGALGQLERSDFGPAGTLLAIGMGIPAFLTIRAAARVWQWWNGLRQRRFLWALTHAQLTVVALLVLLAMVAGLVVIGYTVHAEIHDLASVPGDPGYSIFMQIVIWLLGLALLTLGAAIGGILIFFPIALLFSYLVARGLTRRLLALASAASQMRAGDLSARVPVEGQDEVAQLQANFNSMAADLEARSARLEQRERDLQAERDRTAGLLKAHRELAASVSHELRTPVATARTYLDSALDHWDGAPPETLHADLHILSGEIDRLEKLIDDLFTLSRAEVDRLSLAIAPLDALPLLRRLVATVEKPAWETRRVEVTLEAAPALPRILADAARLEQIVRNLLQNSLRHTPPGGYVLVTAEPAGPLTVRIAVEDSGEGIDPADLPRIWERFYRADSASQSGEGSGLGLALVKELAEAMCGQVGVESRLGEGSRFWIDLPAAQHGCDTIAT